MKVGVGLIALGLIAISFLTILITMTVMAQESTKSLSESNNEMKLLEKYPFDKKCHINITKKSEDNKIIYLIFIENLTDPLYGFEPHEVSVSYSVNDNIYICYDEIKTEYIPLQTLINKIYHDIKNYATYAPDEKAFCTGQVFEGVMGGLNALVGLAQYAAEVSKCQPKYSWWSKCLIHYDDEDRIIENSDSIPDSEIFASIGGKTEEEKNSRRIGIVQFTATALLGATGNDRIHAVRIAIPLKIKDPSQSADLRLWVYSAEPRGSKIGVYLEDPEIGKFKPAKNENNVPEKSGQITNVDWPTKATYDHIESVPVKVDFTNHGSVPHSFWVGYSVQDSTGKWWDAPPQQATATQPGESGSLELKWQPPEDALAGAYTVKVALWEGQNSDAGLMEGEFDSRTKENAFQLNPAQSKALGGWNRTFDGLRFALYVEQTIEGGYSFVGANEANNSEKKANMWLIKTDSSGNEQWGKNFGELLPLPIEDGLVGAQKTDDEGYIFAGTNYSGKGHDGDLRLIKTDSKGNEEWNRTFDASEANFARSVQQTKDRGYIISGYIKKADNTLVFLGAWLVKTDSKGIEEWNRTFTYEPKGVPIIAPVKQTRDGGYIMAGAANWGDPYKVAFWLTKIDSHGKENWNKTLLPGIPYSVEQTLDGGYIVGGSDCRPLTPMIGEIIKTDSRGTAEWNKTIEELGCITNIEQTIDGGYIIVDYKPREDNSHEVYLTKRDDKGNKEWGRTFGGSSADIGATSVKQTNDGGYIVAGFIKSDGANKSDALLIKIDGNGNM